MHIPGRVLSTLLLGLLLSLGLISCVQWPDEAEFAAIDSNPSPYDQEVLADRPVLYLTMGHTASRTETDQSGNGNSGAYFPRHQVASATTMPNGEGAAAFDGYEQYLEVRDDDALSIPTTGVLTIELWLRPDVYDFPVTDKDDYIHWAGKGNRNDHEYAFRMYSLHSRVGRSQRISCYVYNLEGGLGTGAFVQGPVTVGEWIHVVAVHNTRVRTPEFLTGYTRFYKNGEQRQINNMTDYNIFPANGDAPFRVGTRDLGSFLKGAVGKVAIYDYELPAERVRAHYEQMTSVLRLP